MHAVFSCYCSYTSSEDEAIFQLQTKGLYYMFVNQLHGTFAHDPIECAGCL